MRVNGNCSCTYPSATTGPAKQARFEAFLPGGYFAKGALSERNVASIFGRTLFVHGGVAPDPCDSDSAGPSRQVLSELNQSTRRWLRGEDIPQEKLAWAAEFAFTREHSSSKEKGVEYDRTHAELQACLERLDVDRVVVGHSVQESGIAADYGGLVYRIDTGMWLSPFMRPVEVLEIVGDQVSVISEPGHSA